MQVVRLAHAIDFAGWREAARGLRAQGVPPEAALWTVEGHAELFPPPPSGSGIHTAASLASSTPLSSPIGGGGPDEVWWRGPAAAETLASPEIQTLYDGDPLHPAPRGPPPPMGEETGLRRPTHRQNYCRESDGRGEGAFTVPKAFVDLAGRVILHRSEDRLSLLYRLLWRLQSEPNLLRIVSDPDVARAQTLARNVNRAAHKMKAFVRFRLAHDDVGEAYVAWFEPAHRVTEAVAPFFARRFANMRWSILTPDACAHWDLAQLAFTPGADPADAPRDDALEDYWRTYYTSIFNPARLKVGAMQSEMPKRYWRNLPEAGLIPGMIADAQARTREMVAQPATEPSRRVVKAAVRASRDAPYDGQAPTSLAAVAASVDHCRRCNLWRDATQGVPGQGPAPARLMLVGEQPGDQEDLAGQPFVGPAGDVLDRALAEAGVPRALTYVTNAVKHFKHEPRGKRRIHKTPQAGEVSACRGWLDAERRLVRPRVILALGGTAALAVFGKPMAVGENRGRVIALADQTQGLVTFHPSYLLRLPDPEARVVAYDAFVQDLALAWRLAV